MKKRAFRYKKTGLLILFLAIGLILLACSLPGCGQKIVPEPTPVGTTGETGGETPTPTLVPGSIAMTGPGVGTTMLWLDGSTLVYVPGGEFIMGQEGEGLHNVSLDGFWIYKTKVTNRLYALCVDAGVCSPPADATGGPYYRDPEFGNYPVVGVKYEQAQVYCEWIEGRMPTEAQWEKAARGPGGSTYPWGDEDPNLGLLNFDNNIGATSNVYAYPGGASFYGALDMAGNAFEWVADWFDLNFYLTSPSENPIGPVSGERRAVRGSSFESPAEQIPSALRSSADPAEHRADLGFRCIVAVPALLPAPYCETSSYLPGGWASDLDLPGSLSQLFTQFRNLFQPGSSEQTNGCEPISFSMSGNSCQENGVFISLDLNRPVSELGNYSVSAGGAPLNCYSVANYPNRLYCSGGGLRPASYVDITICGDSECADIPSDGQYPRCPEGQYYDTGRQTCVPVQTGNQCPEGYYYDEKRQTCLPEPGGSQYPQCPEGQYYDTGQQACLPLPGDNQCPEGYFFDEKRQTCLPIPTDNQTPPCPEGQYFAAAPQTCEPVPDGNQCPDGYYYDEKRQTCLPVPTGDQTPQCPPGYQYNEKTGQCDYTPSPGTPGDQGCQQTYTAAPDFGCLPGPNDNGDCPPGYYSMQLLDALNNNAPTGIWVCVPAGGPSPCTYGLTYLPDQTQACYQNCLPGYQYNAELQCCEPTDGNQYPDCPVGYYYSTNWNTCLPSYDGGNYPDCPEGYYYSPNARTCLPREDTTPCPQGQYFAAAPQTCEPVPDGNQCPEGYYYDEKRQTCLPIPGGDNPQCPQGYYYDPKRQTCIPVPGGNENSECPQGYYYDEKRQTCLPIPGGDQTPQCPEGYYYDTAKQTCVPTGNQNPECPPTFAYLDTSCLPGDQTPQCLEGQYYDTEQQACVPVPTGNECPQGYYFDEKRQTCLPIPGTDQTPQCPEGYYYSANLGTCVYRNGETPPCPTGYYYDAGLQACIPGTGQPTTSCITIRVFIQPCPTPTPTPTPVPPTSACSQYTTPGDCFKNGCTWYTPPAGGGYCGP